MRSRFEPIAIATSPIDPPSARRVLMAAPCRAIMPAPRRQHEWRMTTTRSATCWQPCSRSRSEAVVTRSGTASCETEAHAGQEVMVVVVPEHVGRHEQDHCQNCADEGIAHQGVADQRSHEYHSCQEAKRLQGQGCQVGHRFSLLLASIAGIDGFKPVYQIRRSTGDAFANAPALPGSGERGLKWAHGTKVCALPNS